MEGLYWLNVSGVVLAVPALALIIPQAPKLEEQTVIPAVPLVTDVFSVITDPLIFVWITAELELFKTI